MLRHEGHCWWVCMQLVCITDPAVAMDMLKSPYVDKVRFLYSFLDPVSLSRLCLLCINACHAPHKIAPVVK